MAYKNPEDQAAASRRHYKKNRAKVIEASKQKRKQLIKNESIQRRFKILFCL